MSLSDDGTQVVLSVTGRSLDLEKDKVKLSFFKPNGFGPEPEAAKALRKMVQGKGGALLIPVQLLREQGITKIRFGGETADVPGA